MFKIYLEYNSNERDVKTMYEENSSADRLEAKLTRLINQWYDNICTIDFYKFVFKYRNEYKNVQDIYRIRQYLQDNYNTEELVLKCYLIDSQLEILNNLERYKCKSNGYIDREFDLRITEVKL